MVIQAYRTGPYATTHENRIFDALLKQLEEVWGDSENLVLLLGNFYCQSCEIDAVVLKKDSITVIDFKDYGGLVKFSENTPWFADNIQIKGGSKPNPFIQIRTNKFALIDKLKEIHFPSDNQPELGHISGLVLFHKPIIFDDRQIPPKIERWFHVVDFDNTIERLSQITSCKISLSNQDLEYIVKILSIPEYISTSCGIKAATFSRKVVDKKEAELPTSLQSAISQIDKFLESSQRILIVTGMVGTGLEQLLSAIYSKTSVKGRNSSVLAPNSRISSSYPLEAKSIYTYIYSGNPRLEEEKLIYDLSESKGTEKHLYIVGDAHLISDSKFETDESRYGSGQLLKDFLYFADLNNSERQIIFLGDPFQITRGKVDESALCKQYVQAIAGFEVVEFSLNHILPQKENDALESNCLKLANSIEEGIFNQLEIISDDLQVIEAPREKTHKCQLIKDLFIGDSIYTKFVAFSHKEVNQINSDLRRSLFGRGDNICAGDIVHIHNSFYVKNKHELEHHIFIQNDSFAEVIEVSEDIQPLVQPLKGRDKPITVNFIKIKARLVENSKEIEFLCLKNYIYAEKPEVDKDTLIVFREYYKQQNQDSHQENVEDLEQSNNSSELVKFLRNDSYLNAARLRFGYALTLHRAQGQKFKTVIANMDTEQGQRNDAYFRWVYTLFSIVKDKIILSNIPLITPLDKSIWDDSQGKIGSVHPRDLIAFDPNAEKGTANIPNFPIPDKPLRNLYLYIVDKLKPEGIEVKSYNHHNYQEVYDLESKSDNVSCSLRLHYNGKYQVTKIEIVKSHPDKLATDIHNIITSNIHLENDFQNKIYYLIKEKLSQCEILIRCIEHHEYQEVYYLKSGNEDVKLQVFYDGDDFITKIFPVVYTDIQAVQKIRLALGL
ncbi:NERD domain-containing protein [Brunnivagina elsteri]|uniref:NERD domain-containing protein n=1 Tax=Brunnivagina elsteri CCALA 953 TaxID=987040 RepID=A0A2A2TIV8_9CYAN|nr:NERD domain-containing protein [Calothrix elsteri]PAX54140.1 hypothetical protein CK510_12695 [Calothrix elsteri CCALA 953]